MLLLDLVLVRMRVVQHPSRPPLHHPHSHQHQIQQQHTHHHPQHQHQHPQDQRRPPLQHHVSSPASSAPTSPQRGPSSSYPSPQLKPHAHSHGTGDRPPQHQQHRESHHHHPPTAASSSSGSRSPC